MRDKGRIEYRKLFRNSGSTDFTGPGKSRRFEYAAALCHEKFDKLLKRMSAFEPEKFLDIFCPVSIHPFL